MTSQGGDTGYMERACVSLHGLLEGKSALGVERLVLALYQVVVCN